MDDLDRMTLDHLATGGTTPAELRRCAIAIRLYGEEAVTLILQRRAESRAYWARVADKWGQSVSRRMTRGRNHDSWATREKYIRGHRESLPPGLEFHASQVWYDAHPEAWRPTPHRVAA